MNTRGSRLVGTCALDYNTDGSRQLKPSGLEGGQQRTILQASKGDRGKQIIGLATLRSAPNNSPGNQFPSRLLQTTDRPNKKGNKDDRAGETFISPLACIFLPSLLPGPFPQRSASATRRHLQSIMINSSHLSHLFP